MRSQAEIDALRAARGGPWPAIRWVHRRRPILTAALVLALPIHTLLTDERPVSLLEPRADWRFVLPWLLMLVGVAIRVWGSGNLRKNQEITSTGVYQLVRHPLYTGSLCGFLAFFLTAGDPVLGLVLFAALAGLVYYATMLGEEEYLSFKFPEQAERREPLPRLVPNLLRLPLALRNDRFSLRSSYSNLGCAASGSSSSSRSSWSSCAGRTRRTSSSSLLAEGPHPAGASPATDSTGSAR